MPLDANFVGVLVFAVTNFIFLLILSFIFWMAVDAAKEDKYWWVVFILGIPVIGGIVYMFVEKKHDYLKLSKKEQEEK
jgi:hypothetical protein